MIDIPIQLRKPEYRFIKVRPNKAPLEKKWQSVNNYAYDDPKFVDYLKKNTMYGVAGGFGNILMIDFDDGYVQQEVIEKLPKTFSGKSANKGLSHKYYTTDNPKSFKIIGINGNTLVDIQGKGKQLIGANSVLLNGKKYEIVDDCEIAFIKFEEIENIFVKYRKVEEEVKKEGNKTETDPICKAIKEKIKISDLLNEYGIDTTTKNTDCPLEHISEGHRCFTYNNVVWRCYNCNKYGNIFQLVMEKEKIDFVEAKNKLMIKAGIQPNYEKPISNSKGELTLLTYRDFEKIKKDRNYIIQDFIPPKSLSMMYSPPTEFKSLISLILSLCIANKKKFLGLKTHKVPVLISDKENNLQILKERLVKLRKGLGIKRKDFPLYFLKRNVANLDDTYFIKQLVTAITEYKIKLIVFDTLHRHSDYDENSANDLNRLYTNVFQPLIDDLGVSILFLHHTTKKGDFRGTGDFLGMVDIAYKVFRYGLTGKFALINKKNRMGELDEITGEIKFGEDKITIERTNPEEEKTIKLSKLKELTNKIKSLFETGQVLKRQDVIFRLDQDKFEYSVPTLNRVLKFLVDNETLQKTNKGYSMMNYVEEIKGEATTEVIDKNDLPKYVRGKRLQ